MHRPRTISIRRLGRPFRRMFDRRWNGTISSCQFCSIASSRPSPLDAIAIRPNKRITFSIRNARKWNLEWAACFVTNDRYLRWTRVRLLANGWPGMGNRCGRSMLAGRSSRSRQFRGCRFCGRRCDVRLERRQRQLWSLSSSGPSTTCERRCECPLEPKRFAMAEPTNGMPFLFQRRQMCRICRYL